MGSWSAVLHAAKGCAMRSKLGWGFVGGVVLVQVLLVPAHAQEEQPTLEVAGIRLSDEAGIGNGLFRIDEPIDLHLDLQNAGDATVTGITGELSTTRAEVLTGTSAWPDIAPGATEANDPAFTVQFDDPFPGVDDGGECFVAFDGLDVVEEEIDNSEEANEAELPDPESGPSDPSEPVEKFPPGTLTFTIDSDQGSLVHEVAFQQACVLSAFGVPEAAAPGGGPRARLATTGASQPLVALLGAGFLVAGGALRRRARIAPALERR